MKNGLLLAAINGAISVLCGAFAAHGLKARLDPAMLEIFETGARYQMFHALAMGLASFAATGPARRAASLSVLLFLTGIVLFSGSLYLLALTGAPILGIVTPFGGLAFLAGWAALGIAALKRS